MAIAAATITALTTLVPWQWPFWRNLNRYLAGSFFGHIIKQGRCQIKGIMRFQQFLRGVGIALRGWLCDQFIDLTDGTGQLPLKCFFFSWRLQRQHAHLGQLFNLMQIVHLIWRNKRQRNAMMPGTASSTNPVNVAVGIGWNIIVVDMRNS